MRGKTLKALLLALCVLGAGFAVYAAGTAGTEDDPLITKSYLDEVVQPELEAVMQEKLDDALSRSRTENGFFRVVTLRQGERLTCAVGTELLPRFGTLTAYAYDPNDTALVDTTDAAAVEDEAALSENHLYMATIAGNGVFAGDGEAKLLVSGEYTIE